MIDYAVDGRGVAILTWNMADRPVNVMNDESLKLFAELIEKALADASVKGVVIASAKRDFVTGADLVSFLSDRRPHIIQEKGRYTQALLRRLESGGKPVCAALTGSALGGGMEIALACHRRIAADKASLRVGLPEVTLGLLPGAGGTQRLPRLIGVRAALPFLLEGKTVGTAEALKAGLIEEVVAEEDVLARSCEWVASYAGAAIQPWDARGFVPPGGALDPVATYQVFATETARITARTQNNLPAAHHILSSVFEGFSTDIDTGLRSELRHFVTCVCSSASKNIIRTQFFGVTDAAKLKRRPASVPPLSIGCLGVVGSNSPALELLRAASAAGLPTRWLAVGGDAATTELPGVKRVDDAVELEGCDVVVRAVDHKLDLTGRCVIWLGPLNDGMPSGSVAIRLAETGRLVEVIRDAASSDEHIAASMDLARQLKKVPLIVHYQRGSYVERVTAAYREAVITLQAEGISSVVINSAARQAGMAKAPLALSADDAALPRTTPERWVQASQQTELVKSRLMLAQTHEALMCLEDGVLSSPLDGDIGALLGWGFPLHLGGPFGYVDTVGAAQVLRLFDRFQPDVPMDARVRQRLAHQAQVSTSFHGD